MYKYFADKNLTVVDVKAIEVERQGLNCYEVTFKLNDNVLVYIGPFSGVTFNKLVEYWTDANNL